MILAYLLECNRYMNLIGIVCMFAIAVFFSHNRAAIKWALVAKALGLQFLIGLLILKCSWGQRCIMALAAGVRKMYLFADVGIGFIFGNLADTGGPWGMIFAVKVLPALIFFGAFIALLFHIGLVQRVVTAINSVVHPYLGTSGIETLSAVATGLLGQTEALFFVRHYLSRMTKAELFVVMTSGMSTVSATLIAVFSAMGVPTTHLLTSVAMSIPGSIMMAKILFPDDTQALDKQQRVESVISSAPPATKNILDALASGTADGLNLALNIGAMLISFLALLALVNYTLAYTFYMLNFIVAYTGVAWRFPELTLDMLFAYALAPLGYLLGFEGYEALAAGQLLGKKIAINEFVAYSALLSMHLSERVLSIMTYVLCGFSNFSCIGIQLGSIGVLAPERRAWVAQLGMYAVLGGALSNLVTGMIAALLI